MIWDILGAVVMAGALMVAVALCRGVKRGNEMARQRDEYRDFWQG